MHTALAVVLASVQKSCEKGNHVEIAKLLQDNSAIRQNITIFSLPSFPNCADCLQIAIDSFTDDQLRCTGSLNRNALVAAIILGENNLRAVKVLVTYGGGTLVNMPDTFGRTAVHYAVIREDLDILQAIVEHGSPNMRQQDFDGNTLLHQFFIFGCKNTKILEYLIDTTEQCRDLMDTPNRAGSTPTDLIQQKQSISHLMDVRIMRPGIKRFSIDDIVILKPERVEIPDLEKLTAIISRHPNARDSDGNTLLHHVAKYGASKDVLAFCLRCSEIVKLVNSKNNDGVTPLHVAVIHENIEVIDALLEIDRLDQQLCDRDGALPINYAIQNKKIFFKLFDADPNILFAIDGNGMTPLCLLLVSDSFNDSTDSVDGVDTAGDWDPSFLSDSFSYGFKVNENKEIKPSKQQDNVALKIFNDVIHHAPLMSKDKLGRTIFHYLAMFGRSNFLRDMILNDLRPILEVQLNQRDLDGCVPFAYALLHRNILMLEIILTNFSPDLTIIDVTGKNCLHLALNLTDLDRDWVRLILHHQPSLAHSHCPDNNYDPYPIMSAIRSADFLLVQTLVDEYKVDLKVKSDDQNNVWHFIALYGVEDEQIIEYLLGFEEAVSVVRDRNIYGQTAQQIAEAKGNMTLLEQLNLRQLNCYEEEDIDEALGLDCVEPDGGANNETKSDTSNISPESQTDDNKLQSKWHNQTVSLKNGVTKEGWDVIGSCNEYWKRLKTCLKEGYMSKIMVAVDDFEMRCPSLMDEGGNTPLHLLCYLESLSPALADYFLLQTKKIKNLANSQNRYGETPLHVAARQQNLHMLLALLVQPGINLSLRNLKGETFLLAAINNGRSDAKTDICLYKTVTYAITDQNRLDLVNIPSYTGRTPLMSAVHRDLFDVVQLLVEEGGAPLDHVDADGNSILHHLATYKRQDARILNYLIQSKAIKMLNKENLAGETPLHVAARVNNTRYVKRLLEQKRINIKKVDHFKSTPLLLALMENNADTDLTLIDALLEKAPFMATAYNLIGISPLHYSLRIGRLDIFQKIVEVGGIDVKAWRDKQQNTLLHYLALYHVNSTDIGEFLIKKAESSINACNSLGDTALHYLCYDGCNDLIEIFLECDNIDVSILDTNKNSVLLLYLAKHNHSHELSIVELMLRKRPQLVNEANNENVSPLFKTIQVFGSKSRWLLQTMLKYGSVNFDVVDNRGCNVFHHLAANVQNEQLIRSFIVAYMQQPAANVSRIMEVPNMDGRTPIDVAKLNKNEAFMDVVEMS